MPASISGLFSPDVRVTMGVTPEASASESAVVSVPALVSVNSAPVGKVLSSKVT